MSLNDYLQKNLFEPLGIENISMFPNDHMKQNLATMHQRWPYHKGAEERDHILRRPLVEDKKNIFNSAGAGCFAKPAEYCRAL